MIKEILNFFKNFNRIKLISKKGDVSQIFVYVFSIIVVVFASSLIISFVTGFLGSSEGRQNSIFYQDFEKHFYSVYTTIGSEKSYNYKLSSKVELVCFMSNRESIIGLEEDLKVVSGENTSILYDLFDGGARIVLFDIDTIINSHTPKYDFIAQNATNTGSFCINPKGDQFSIIYENKKGKVYINKD